MNGKKLSFGLIFISLIYSSFLSFPNKPELWDFFLYLPVIEAILFCLVIIFSLKEKPSSSNAFGFTVCLVVTNFLVVLFSMSLVIIGAGFVGTVATVIAYSYFFKFKFQWLDAFMIAIWGGCAAAFLLMFSGIGFAFSKIAWWVAVSFGLFLYGENSLKFTGSRGRPTWM